MKGKKFVFCLLIHVIIYFLTVFCFVCPGIYKLVNFVVFITTTLEHATLGFTWHGKWPVFATSHFYSGKINSARQWILGFLFVTAPLSGSQLPSQGHSTNKTLGTGASTPISVPQPHKKKGRHAPIDVSKIITRHLIEDTGSINPIGVRKFSCDNIVQRMVIQIQCILAQANFLEINQYVVFLHL